MKGYWNGYSYMGWMPDRKRYMPFTNDTEYREAYEEVTAS